MHLDMRNMTKAPRMVTIERYMLERHPMSTATMTSATVLITFRVTPQCHLGFFLVSFHQQQFPLAQSLEKIPFAPMLSGQGEDKQPCCGQLIGLRPVPGDG